MIPFLFKMAWRETRAAWRHFIYFLVCIAVGVGALVAVSLFGAHVERAVTKEARGLLGGDLEVRWSRPASPGSQQVLSSLADRQISVTHVSELVAMAAKIEGPNEKDRPTQIIELKAVEPHYPLYGALRVIPEEHLPELLGPHGRGCRGEPAFGVVVQEALLIRMDMTVGDCLKIGQGRFMIRGVLRTEPDRMANAFSLGPRVMMSQDGLRSAELIKLGSRIRERYLLKTPSSVTPEPLLYELRSRLGADGARVSSYREAQPQLRQFLEQLTRYLGLIGLTALFIGGLGVATSVHAFVREKFTTIAILKTLGADSVTVIWTYLVQALLLGMTGSILGLLLGVLLQQALPWVMARMLASDMLEQVKFVTDLTTVSVLPLGKGLALGLLSTALFALWPLLAIRAIKPAAIFRRGLVAASIPGTQNVAGKKRGMTIDRVKISTSVALAIGLALLSIWQAGSWKIGLLFIGAFAAALLLLGTSAWIVVALLKKIPRPHSLTLRGGLDNIVRPGSQAVPVTIAIGIGVMVVMTVSLVESALLRQVGDKRPINAPTFFFIDIQPDQTEEFTHLLKTQSGDPTPSLTPLVRSRLSALNGQPVTVEAVTEEEEQKAQALEKDERRKKWYLSREYVLTFLEDLPKDNEIVKGEWWKAGQVFPKPLVSIEEEAAKSLGLEIGGTIDFEIQGTILTTEVSSIRKVDWGNLSTNFYMIVSPGALEGAPLTYVATVHVAPPEEVPLQQAVVAKFPNVTAINIGDVLQNFSAVLDRLAVAIRAVALFCVVAGSLVMAASLAATRYRRLYESVILKAVGATRGLLARSFAVEYAVLGAVGGVLGAALASALSWALLTMVFDLPWSVQPKLLALGFHATIVLTVVVGFLSTYRILGQAPLSVLRQE